MTKLASCSATASIASGRQWVSVATYWGLDREFAASAPAAQAPMNMANMDHRGVVRGTVRGANKAPAADTAVIAVDTVTGARFEAMTNAQGAYSFDALPVGSYNITVVSAGLTAFRRQGLAVGLFRVGLDKNSAKDPGKVRWCPQKAGDIRPVPFRCGETHSIHDEEPKDAAA